MMVFFIKILLAHLLGDFVFQPERWLREKQEKLFRAPALYKHLVVHTFLLILLLQWDYQYWMGIVFILFSHLVIDLINGFLQHRWNPSWTLALDQLAHITVLILVTYMYFPDECVAFTNNFRGSLLLILSFVLLTSVSSIVMKTILRQWENDVDLQSDSLINAGKYIGMLERLFVFGFILIQQWQAIGLLIAAKSVFRFGDLSRAKDRKLTEYILIGTLLSIGLALLIGAIYLQMAEILTNKEIN